MSDDRGTPDRSKVICPNCAHQFGAISEADQAIAADLREQLAEARRIAWDWAQGVTDAETAIRQLNRMFPIDAAPQQSEQINAEGRETSRGSVAEARDAGIGDSPAPSAPDSVEVPSIEDIRGAVARGWCHEANSRKVMDPDLATAIACEVHALLVTANEQK